MNMVAGAVAIGGTALIVYQVIRGGKTVAQAAGAALDAVNPANPENVVARAANAVARAVTGDQSTTFGGWLYDKFSGDDSGAVAIAPSPMRNSPKSIMSADDVDDFLQELGNADEIVAPPSFDGSEFQSNEGGAAFGNPFMRKP